MSFRRPTVAREELDLLHELFSVIADPDSKRLSRSQLAQAATNYVGEQVLVYFIKKGGMTAI